MKKSNPAGGEPFIPPLKDVHRFSYGGSLFAIDANSLTVFKIDDQFWRLLGLDSGTTMEKAREALQREYGIEQTRQIVEDLQELQERGIFSSPQEPVKAPYRAKRYKLSLGVSDVCNLRCKYCYAKDGKALFHGGGKMDAATAERAVDFLVTDFGREALDYEVNIVGGGEPLLNFELVRTLREYCLQWERKTGKRIYFWLFTNGTVFTEEMIAYLCEHRQGLTVSLDGPESVHNQLRPFPDGRGSYPVIRRWIGLLQQRAESRGHAENLWASAVVSSKHTALREVVTEFVNLGIASAMIRPVRTRDPELALSESNIDRIKEAYRGLIELILEKTLAGDLRYIKLVLTQRDFLGRFILRLLFKIKSNYRCDAAKSHICILSNGDIFPCDISCGTGELKIGNLLNDPPLAEQMRSLYFRQEVDERKACRLCWARYICGGGCYYSAFIKNNTIEDPDAVICELTRLVIELSAYFLYEVQERQPDIARQLYRYAQYKEKFVDIKHQY